jgi:NitT/TauT family transport system ATP-binding protein
MERAGVVAAPESAAGVEPAADDYAISLANVYKRYPDGTGGEKTVLNDIDLRVRGGELTTLVGPSGCGKSTLFRLILGAEPPSTGEVLVNGVPASQPNRDCGIVYQKYSLFPHLTVVDNIVFGLELQEFSLWSRLARFRHYRERRKAFAERARRYLERSGLAEHADKHPYQLSGGMRQRVAIAQALITQPRVLLMDEPFGALDANARQDMQLVLLEQWQQTRMTVLFVTHDLEEALFLGTRVVVLSQYYSSDWPGSEGAKIVKDCTVPGDHPKPTGFKHTPEFAELVEEIQREGLNPEYRRHIREFDLSHRDAFRTVNDEEWKR